MPTLQQLETALVNADKAGDVDAARRLAAAVKAARADAPSQIPGAAANMGSAVVQPEGPGIVDRALGAGEAALSTITGATTGLAGGALNFIGVLGEEIARKKSGEYLDDVAVKRINEAFGAGQRAGTYQPRTEAGQEALGVVADVGQGLAPLAGLGGELALIAQAGRAARTGAPAATTARAAAEGTARDIAGPAGAAAAQTAIDATSRAAGAMQEAAKLLPKRTSALIFGEEAAAPTAGTRGSAGAAGTDLAMQRDATASNLPVPIRLTEGQRSRDFAQQRFEQETAKDPSLGAPLRENSALQNRQLAQNFEALIDDVGATAPDLREAGRTVTTELSNAAARSKREYRAKYQAADKAGELRAPVNLDALVDHLNQVAPEASTAPLISTARNLAIRMGIAKEQGGVLVPVRGGRPDTMTNARAPDKVTLKTAETFRQAINRNIDTEPTNIRQGTIIKQLIDEATEGQGGDLYRGARKARQRHAELFEDNAIVSDLLTNRRNTADRRVALEDVFRRSILNGDRESIGMLRRTIDVSDQKAGFKPQTDGPGAQAWRELQGATLRHLLDEATKGVATDVAGNPIFSAAKLNNAVNALDRGGRLDFVLGKKQAQLVRDLNEVAKVVLTAPPGAVNTSNTASVVLAAIAEAGLTGSMTGLPVPVLSAIRAGSQFVKDVKVRRRVEAALRGNQNDSTVARRSSIKIREPENLTARPFEYDYPTGSGQPAGSRIATDIEGRPLVAEFVAGRREWGGSDVPVTTGESVVAGGGLGAQTRVVPAKDIGGDAGRYVRSRGADGETKREILIRDGLDDQAAGGVYQHEFSHLVDDLVHGGIDTAGIKKELQQVYHDLNAPFRSGKGKWGPESAGYKGADVDRELVAEAIRAYLSNPNYFKTVAPKAAAKIRAAVNSNSNLNRVIQFNSIAVPIGAGFAMHKLGLFGSHEQERAEED